MQEMQVNRGAWWAQSVGSQKSQTRLRDKTAVEAYGSGLEPMLPEQGWREGREAAGLADSSDLGVALGPDTY